MLSCKDVGKLRSQALDRPLTWREWLGVKLHLLACEACRRFDRQMAILRQAMQHLSKPDAASEQPALSAEAKTRILKKMPAQPPADH